MPINLHWFLVGLKLARNILKIKKFGETRILMPLGQENQNITNQKTCILYVAGFSQTHEAAAPYHRIGAVT